jgi:hypothetical protein
VLAGFELADERLELRRHLRLAEKGGPVGLDVEFRAQPTSQMLLDVAGKAGPSGSRVVLRVGLVLVHLRIAFATISNAIIS